MRHPPLPIDCKQWPAEEPAAQKGQSMGRTFSFPSSFSRQSETKLFINEILGLISLSDMEEEECYPAISMNTATNGHGDPRKYQPSAVNNAVMLKNGHQHAFMGSGAAAGVATAAQNRTLHHHTYASNGPAIRGRVHDMDDNLSDDEESDCSSIDSDEVDIDETIIKEEPLSPSSSCPPSPVMNSKSNTCSSKTRSKSKMLNNINLSEMAALTNTDLVFEHTVSVGSIYSILRPINKFL